MTTSEELKKATEYLEKNKRSEEPAVTVGVVSGGIAAAVSTMLYLFPNLTEHQIRIILIAACLLVPIIASFNIRSRAWSSASVRHLLWLTENEKKRAKTIKSEGGQSGLPK